MVNRVGWGRNLDTLNDILRGDFGTPDESYVLIWKNSKQSREMLEYSETVLFLDEIWQRFNLGLSYPEITQRDHERLAQYLEDEKLVKQEVERYQEGYHDLESRLASAKLNEGDKVFNWNVATIKEKDIIELRLEWHDAGAPDRVWACSCQLLGWLTIL